MLLVMVFILIIIYFMDYSNPNAKTIEGDLFKAMVQAGAVSKDNSDDIKKVRIQL